MNMKLVVLTLLALSISGISRADGAWSTEDYDFYAGDFNGDGHSDLLYIAKAANRASGILLSDGSSPSIDGQSWVSNYLGIPWADNAYNVVVADFSGDGKTDIFLQSTTGGDSYLLITDTSGQVSAISQTIAAGAMGLDWSASSHVIHAGDFNGDGKADLLLQSTFSEGIDAVVAADANGQFTSEVPLQIWTDGFLGFDWSTNRAAVSVGDFNGDGRADLLVQAYPDYIGNSSPIYSPDMNGVAFGGTGTTPFTLTSMQSWSRAAFGVDWSPLLYNLVVADFNGDGCADVLMQPLFSGQNAYLVTGNRSGPAFADSGSALSTTTDISLPEAHLIPGLFGSNAGAGLYIQATASSGTNYLAPSIVSGVQANPVASPEVAQNSAPTAMGNSTDNMATDFSASPALASAAIAPPATLPNTYAGRTAAQFSVTPTGAASYNIPLWTPPGVRNIEPHLALRYTAGGADGLMGPGWALSGLSSIARCGKTWASSGGAPAGITTTASDDFCLDGNRLRVVTGYTAYCPSGGTPQTTYMTEIADFSLVSACGTAGNGPAYFEVQGKDSHYYEYGNTANSANSRISATGATTPYAWALDKVSDRQSNKLLVTYNAGSSISPAAIGYTAIASAPTVYHYTVSFSYAARTGGTTLTKYVAGFPVTQTQQLTKINVISDWPSANTSVRQYLLNYGSSATTNRPMLATVQECGGSTGNDCLRPTTINYQTGGSGWWNSAVSLSGPTGQYGLIPLDLNGDSVPDVLYAKLSGTNLVWYARIGTTTGYGPEIPTGATTPKTTATPKIIPGSFLGNGKTQFLAPVGSTWNVYTYNTSGFSNTSSGVPVGTGTNVSGEYFVVDYDGDGLPDLMSINSTGFSVLVRRNTSTGSTVSFAPTATSVFTTTDTYGLSPITIDGLFTGTDLNGDGKADILVASSRPIAQGGTLYRWNELLSNGFSAQATAGQVDQFTAGNPPAVSIGDWNADGCSDIVSSAKIYVSHCDGGFTVINTGAVALTSVALYAVDWDGDGQSDLVYVNGSDATVYVARSTGNGIATPVSTGFLATTKGFFIADQNSDGQPDLMYVDTANNYAVGYYPHNLIYTPPDLASSIVDGFGITFTPTYWPLTQGNYTPNSDATFPNQDFQGPMYVVKQFTASDGTGGTYTNSFWYYGARLNVQGHGFEGFESTRQYDSRTLLYQFQHFRRDFPFIGSLAEQDLCTSSTCAALSVVGQTVNTYLSQDLAGTSCSQRCFPYLRTSRVYHYELSGNKTGISTSNTLTTYTYSTDGYGNLVNTVATSTDTDALTPASPFNAQSWTTTIANTPVNSAATWCLGRPSSSTTTKTTPGQPTLTRTVAHTVDTTACRASDETVEPGTALEVKTTFGFDACGNTNSVSVVGKDRNGVAMPARVTGTSYGTRCQFAESVTNPLNQTTTTGYRYDLGVPTSSTDPNLITTSWLYDSFARKTQETRPDGTYSKLTYYDCVAASCWGLTNLRFRTNEQLYSNTNALVRQSDRYSDGMDRIRRVESDHALGTHVVDETTTYDGLGRKTRVDLPWSTSSNGYHVYGYDSGNRILSDVLYTGAGVSYRTIGISYSGQTVTVTDPKGFPVTKITDVAGNLRWVTDPNNNGTVAGTTKYTYDAFNNIVTIQDADINTSSYQYNIRGFKVSATDADTGAWTFVPDSLNELVSQTDAKSQTTTFGYDALGRMTSRIEATESSTPTTWTYGTSQTLHEIGRIKTVSKPDGYGESYAYDSLGRPQTVTYTEDAVNYRFDYTYNSLGGVDTLTYPTSTSGVRFALKSVPDAYGFLNQVKDNSAGTVFWTLQSNNDSSLPTGELLGNGVKVTTSYTPQTNEMVTRQEGSGGSTTNLQNLSYAWDLNGNLSQRQDLRQSLTEIFTLDAMNRITNATLNGSQTLAMTYYASGNIRKKSDVSANDYVYSPTHPHAVTTAGSWTLAYDANGNMTARAGSTITWYSYNLPNLINYGTSSAQFFYNASHQRWKQIANYAGTVETTHYIGGLLEIMIKGTVTEYRHQIPAGSAFAVYTRRDSGTNSTYYATSDHLGSADVVMDSAGTVLVRESFTPFGARRGGNWQGVPTTPDYTAFDTTTRRGFTGHEMLDTVSLVHMNGRVYDPYLGRFISADTLVSNIAATQSVNPYSYAWNDPLKYIDPSGHDFGETFFQVVCVVIGAIISYYTFGALGGFDGTLGFWGTVAAGAVAGFVGGFISSAFMTGDLSAALNAGLAGALTGALFAGVGYYADNPLKNWTWEDKLLAHAAVGCISGAASGGNCGKDAFAAAVSEEANIAGLDKWAAGHWGGPTGAAVAAGIVGGTAERIAGGDFVEGFSTSAAGYLFNHLGNLRVGADAHMVLLHYLENQDDQFSGDTTFFGLFGDRRPDVIYDNLGSLYGWELKPEGQDAAALKRLNEYIEASDGKLRAGPNRLIFRNADTLTLPSIWLGGRTDYTYYPGVNGVITYSVSNTNIFDFVLNAYRMRQPNAAKPLVIPAPIPAYVLP